MSLSEPAKVVAGVFGVAALLGWGSAIYLWTQSQSETLTVAEAIAKVKDDVGGKQDIEASQDQIPVEGAIAKGRVQLDEVTSKLDSKHSTSQEIDADFEERLPWEPLALDPVMTTVPVQTPMGLRLSLVHFDRGSADVSPGGQRKANEVAAWVKTHGAETIQIMGFADTRGSQAANRKLSERRARSIAALLESAGISSTKLEIIPHGEDRLPEATKDQVSEPLNRCVGIFIAPSSAAIPG